MAFGESQGDYDYVISNAEGVIGVKGGQEYPIDEERWHSWHKEHKDSGCTECSFVQDKETLFIYLVSRELKDKATKKPVFVGKFTMPGWVGHSGFYVFKCIKCGIVCVDFPHGYTDFGLLFLRCDHCQERFVLELTKEKAVYEKESVHIPKPTRKERIKDFSEMIAGIEDKGVRVIIPGLEIPVVRNWSNNVWVVGLLLLGILTLGIAVFKISN